uniref:C2H2-type domain-containing protein n=1 Tax=Denticeps clupeoides TaxID=299321 RepID=A0AAY4BF03_9TELE
MAAHCSPRVPVQIRGHEYRRFTASCAAVHFSIVFFHWSMVLGPFLVSINCNIPVTESPRDLQSWLRHTRSFPASSVSAPGTDSGAGQKIHTGEKAYRCPDCGKHFITSSHLKTHSYTHTGERPFKCSLCDKQFRQWGGLQVHTRNHMGEKPYRCSVCGYATVTMQQLKKHQLVHTRRGRHSRSSGRADALPDAGSGPAPRSAWSHVSPVAGSFFLFHNNNKL